MNPSQEFHFWQQEGSKEVNELKLVITRNNNRSRSEISNRSRQRSRSSSRAMYSKWKMGENNYCF